MTLRRFAWISRGHCSSESCPTSRFHRAHSKLADGPSLIWLKKKFARALLARGCSVPKSSRGVWVGSGRSLGLFGPVPCVRGWSCVVPVGPCLALWASFGERFPRGHFGPCILWAKRGPVSRVVCTRFWALSGAPFGPSPFPLSAVPFLLSLFSPRVGGWLCVLAGPFSLHSFVFVRS